MERKKNEEFVKIVYVSETEVLRRRGRPVVRWKGRWRLFCCSYPLEGHFQKELGFIQYRLRKNCLHNILVCLCSCPVQECTDGHSQFLTDVFMAFTQEPFSLINKQHQTFA